MTAWDRLEKQRNGIPHERPPSVGHRRALTGMSWQPSASPAHPIVAQLAAPGHAKPRPPAFEPRLEARTDGNPARSHRCPLECQSWFPSVVLLLDDGKECTGAPGRLRGVWYASRGAPGGGRGPQAGGRERGCVGMGEPGPVCGRSVVWSRALRARVAVCSEFRESVRPRTKLEVGSSPTNNRSSDPQRLVRERRVARRLHEYAWGSREFHQSILSSLSAVPDVP